MRAKHKPNEVSATASLLKELHCSVFLWSDGPDRAISFDHVAGPCRKAVPRLPAAALRR
jgi:hypothetical protein